MARGVQLITLVTRLRAEIGHDVAVSTGVNTEEHLKQVIRRTQETLYDDFDWPFMRVNEFKTLSAGQQYYDLPTNLNIERVENVAAWWNGEPHPIDRGIGIAEYAAYSSSDDERADPVLKWDVKDNDGSPQIEVWPLPSSNSQRLLVTGIRNLNALTSNSDTADLDDVLILLFAAAELLSRQKSEDARLKLAAAQQRYATLKSRHKGGAPMFQMNGGGEQNRLPRGKTIIRIGS